MTEAEMIAHAEDNKRYYGFNSYYSGNNLERSRKR